MNDSAGPQNNISNTNQTQREWSAVLMQLYGDHYQMLVSSAQRLLDTRVLAEEAVQEAFVRYHTAKNQPALGKELSYLHSIVLNLARGMLRRRQTADRWRPDLPRHEQTPEDAAVIRSAAEVVAKAIQGLPPRQRQVIELRFMQGHSEQETANLLAISTGSVKTHGHRARASLAAALVGQV